MKRKRKISLPLDKLISSLIGIMLVSGVFAQITLTQPLSVDHFDFYIDTVYVAQEDQEVIGYHWKSKSGKTYTFKKANSISSGLQDYFDKSFPSESGKQPLIIRINKIVCSTSDVSEKSNTLLHISFLKLEDDKYYHLFSTSAAYPKKQMEYGISLKNVIDKNLRKALHVCFDDFVKNYDPSEKELISNSELNSATSLYQNELDILKSNRNGEAGSFKSFSDFSSNRSVVDEDLHLKKVVNKKVGYYYEPQVVEDNQPTKYHMIFDGKGYFINHEDNYHKLYLTDKNSVQFLVLHENEGSGFLANLLGISTGLGVGAVLRNNTDFGILISAVIVGVTAGTVYYIVSEISKNIKGIHQYELDLLTGHIFRIS